MTRKTLVRSSFRRLKSDGRLHFGLADAHDLVEAHVVADGDLLGVLLCLLSAVVYSISLILQKPLMVRLPAVQVTWLACTVGAISCLPFLGDLVTQVAPGARVMFLPDDRVAVDRALVSGRTLVTPAPTSTTTPAPSWPRMAGKRAGGRARRS